MLRIIYIFFDYVTRRLNASPAELTSGLPLVP
jgi:hypothetical protein